MSSQHLGRKYTCYSCHTKFYDLGKAEPLCPKCGADQRDAEEKPVASTHRSKRVVIEQPPEADFDVEEEEITPQETETPVEEELEQTETVEPAEEEEEDEEDQEEF